jgi:hypothetical protein
VQDVQRQVHVKVIKLSDSNAASSAWRELVMLLQVHLISHYCATLGLLCSVYCVACQACTMQNCVITDMYGSN